ncbi:MAG: ASCH domain-containing protein [Actinomycetaceae bacterium]|nr:ASCH domain-containing protein [Actinomycetaceae bacterium]
MENNAPWTEPVAEPISALVDAFWKTSSKTFHMAGEDAYMGSNEQGMLTPVAWSFGDNAELADRLLQLVLDGKKTGTASSYEDYILEEEEIPQVGDLSIICDSKGVPAALIKTIQVDVVDFLDVTAEHAAAEGEGDGSLEYWRTAHEAYFSGQPKVVLERFKVIARAEGRKATDTI